MPTLLTDDPEAAKGFLTNRNLGTGTAAGNRNYIIDRVAEIVETGVDEIMFGGILTDHPDEFDRFEEEVLSAFD